MTTPAIGASRRSLRRKRRPARTPDWAAAARGLPKRKTERREQILAAARRCFAELGYEGATVVRLEEATGLSAVREVMDIDAAWLAVYLELIRRGRTDAEFRGRIEARQAEVAPVNRAKVEQGQRSGEFRDDVEAKEIGIFVNLVLNGLALQRASGDEPLSAELVLSLLGDAIGGRAPADTPPRTRP